MCLTAPSGAGKTTLLRILLGLEQPDRGEVLAPPGTRWSAVFQEDRLLEHLDARDNLRFVLGAVSPEALTLLETLGLGDVGGKIVAEYSGGMRRRLALARALLSPCDALVLDEPFTGLDPEIRARCWEQGAPLYSGQAPGALLPRPGGCPGPGGGDFPVVSENRSVVN